MFVLLTLSSLSLSPRHILILYFSVGHAQLFLHFPTTLQCFECSFIFYVTLFWFRYQFSVLEIKTFSKWDNAVQFISRAFIVTHQQRVIAKKNVRSVFQFLNENFASFSLQNNWTWKWWFHCISCCCFDCYSANFVGHEDKLLNFALWGVWVRTNCCYLK